MIFFIANAYSNVTDPYIAFDQMQHENKGCPINSDCSENMGQKILKWEKLLKKVTAKNKIQQLQKQLSKKGIPLEFLTTKKAKIALDPVMWNSRCSLHNPKNPNNNIFKAMQFFKNIPSTEHVIMTPVTLYDGLTELKYTIPYQDQILMIKNKKMILIRDYDDFYYYIGVDLKGNISIEDPAQAVINMALDKKITETKCPKKMQFDSTYFTKTYCQKIYNADSKSLDLIQYAWSCP